MWQLAAMAAMSMIQNAQQSRINNKLSEQNRDAAVVSQTYENRSLNERLREEQEIAGDKALEMKKEALKATSTLQARGRNISGADGLSQEIVNDLGTALGQLRENVAGKQRQTALEKKGTTSRAESRINSMPKTKYNPAMDLASAGLSIYGDFKGSQRSHSAATGGKGVLEFGDYFWGRK